ncbi:MAG: NAD(+)/NADH kinase [Lachnospiraceae bacterium]|nr:NAD(+)/NADH kinase [Lachnospiraceae bacterium]
MKNFYIITNECKDPDFEITYRIRDYLVKCGRNCMIRNQGRNNNGHTDISLLKDDVDCVLVLGGDGTLLQAAVDLADLSMPFLGINLGTLGFLAEVNKADIEPALEKLLAGEYEIEKRMMLVGYVYGPDQEKDNTRALNDIVITRKGSLQIITFTISVNGQFLHRYSADGIIVATPTGSTGYNLSAGGPVVDPKAQLMVISPICPHSMQHNSIVLSPEDEITITIETGHDGIRQEVEAIFDGSHRVTLFTDDKIVIKRSEKTTGIVKLNKASFLEILHGKMND